MKGDLDYVDAAEILPKFVTGAIIQILLNKKKKIKKIIIIIKKTDNSRFVFPHIHERTTSTVPSVKITIIAADI